MKAGRHRVLEGSEAAGFVAFALPLTIGTVTMAYNVPGLEELRLTGEEFAEIYLERITRWNDSVPQELNPGVDFPDRAIVVVHRSEGSGTTRLH